MAKFQVNPRSIAEQSGLKVGDVIQDINGMTTAQMKHQEAQQTIINAGNRISLNINRSVICIRFQSLFSQRVRKVCFPRVIPQKKPDDPTTQTPNPINWKPHPQKLNSRPQPKNPNPQTTVNGQK